MCKSISNTTNCGGGGGFGGGARSCVRRGSDALGGQDVNVGSFTGAAGCSTGRGSLSSSLSGCLFPTMSESDETLLGFLRVVFGSNGLICRRSGLESPPPRQSDDRVSWIPTNDACVGLERIADLGIILQFTNVAYFNKWYSNR